MREKYGFYAFAAILVVGQAVGGIDYRKNMISGGGMTNRSTFTSFSSTSISMNGSNVASEATDELPRVPAFEAFDWADRGLGRKTLDQRIRDAEQRLNKLLFMRDVCRKLEDEIRISFEKKDIREVVEQVSECLGSPLPCEVPDGVYLVDKSDVSGMPADQFLASIAGVCGLTLRYEHDKLVFLKPEKKAIGKKPSGAAK